MSGNIWEFKTMSPLSMKKTDIWFEIWQNYWCKCPCSICCKFTLHFYHCRLVSISKFIIKKNAITKNCTDTQWPLTTSLKKILTGQYLWEVSITDRPSWMRLRIRFHKNRRECGSIPVVGSSCKCIAQLKIFLI